MTGNYAVDTHGLIWYLEDHPRLGVDAGRVMDNPAATLFLPAIALMEACWIVEHGRCRIPTVGDLLRDVDADPRFIFVPLDRETIDASLALTAIREVHDRLIVATAQRLILLGEADALLTRDNSIRQSGLVPVIW